MAPANKRESYLGARFLPNSLSIYPNIAPIAILPRGKMQYGVYLWKYREKEEGTKGGRKGGVSKEVKLVLVQLRREGERERACKYWTVDPSPATIAAAAIDKIGRRSAAARKTLSLSLPLCPTPSGVKYPLTTCWFITFVFEAEDFYTLVNRWLNVLST